MRKLFILSGVMFVCISFRFAYGFTVTIPENGTKDIVQANDNEIARMDKGALRKQFSEVPDESVLLKNPKARPVYEELKLRYAAHLLDLKKESEILKAKLVIVILTPEVGESVTRSTRIGIPYIVDLCKKNGIDVYDLSPKLSTYKPTEITQMPLDGHWSKRGDEIVAEELSKIINGYSSAKSPVTFTTAQRTKTFGDLESNMNQILDGNKDIPYNIVTNSQGLRMDFDLQFPKTKQRILFLGDSQIYSPFLDNNEIATGVLQKKYGDKEILNAGVIGWSIDDYLSLLREKAKYAEPDLIFIITNPNDIIDQFFTQRNKMSRNTKGFYPSKAELELYREVYKK